MRYSFRYALLITWAILTVSCKTYFVQNGYQAKNISVSDELSKSNQDVVALYLPYKSILEEDMNKVISVSTQELFKKKPESSLTNFLADILLEEAEKECSAQNLNITPDISFFNYGGIRAPLPKGEITVGNIFELMPFENEMVFLLLKGNQMQEFLNYVARNGGGSVGGARFSIKDKKAINGEIKGKTIDPNKSYWLVTNDYVAAGGDGLEVLRKNEQFIKSGQKIRDLIIENMQSRHDRNEKINIELDGRIRYE